MDLLFLDNSLRIHRCGGLDTTHELYAQEKLFDPPERRQNLILQASAGFFLGHCSSLDPITNSGFDLNQFVFRDS